MTVLILIFCKILFTREEAAESLGISVRKLDQLAARGDIKPRQIDDSVRSFIGELVRFANLNTAEVKQGGNASEAKNDHAA
jgi:hypothetical protein